MAAARERSATTGTAYQLDVPSALQLYDQIGKGSYGSVFSARYQQRLAAVKAVPIEPGPDGKEMSLEIRREMELLGKCDSEYVVRFYGCMHKGRTLWIAMELCDGSVSDVLRVTAEALREDEVAVVCAAVVRGLAYLHEQQHILHRDIKAGNILLSSQGAGGIKLCDLGVSASVANHTKRSTVIGTPLWMSPELIESGSYGTPTDVWSLGITALEMAERRPPHSDVSPTIRALFLITSSPPPTLAEPHKWSEECADFVAQCVVKEPALRPPATALEPHPFVQRGLRLGTPPILTMLSRMAAAKAGGGGGGGGGGDGTIEATLDLMEATAVAGTLAEGAAAAAAAAVAATLKAPVPPPNAAAASAADAAAAASAADTARSSSTIGNDAVASGGGEWMANYETMPAAGGDGGTLVRRGGGVRRR